ncbi:hypothetical protein ACEQ8H_008835 [Pleosporales sp. CAS-2024a]
MDVSIEHSPPDLPPPYTPGARPPPYTEFDNVPSSSSIAEVRQARRTHQPAQPITYPAPTAAYADRHDTAYGTIPASSPNAAYYGFPSWPASRLPSSHVRTASTHAYVDMPEPHQPTHPLAQMHPHHFGTRSFRMFHFCYHLITVILVLVSIVVFLIPVFMGKGKHVKPQDSTSCR